MQHKSKEMKVEMLCCPERQRSVSSGNWSSPTSKLASGLAKTNTWGYPNGPILNSILLVDIHASWGLISCQATCRIKSTSSANKFGRFGTLELTLLLALIPLLYLKEQYRKGKDHPGNCSRGIYGVYGLPETEQSQVDIVYSTFYSRIIIIIHTVFTGLQKSLFLVSFEFWFGKRIQRDLLNATHSCTYRPSIQEVITVLCSHKTYNLLTILLCAARRLICNICFSISVLFYR